MWGEILGTVVGGVAKTLVDNGKNNSGNAAANFIEKPNYQGFMMPIEGTKRAGQTEARPAPVAGGTDAVQSWMQLLSSYKGQ